MPAPLSEKEVARRLSAITREGGVAAAARKLGVRPATFTQWYHNGIAAGRWTDVRPPAPPKAPPAPPKAPPAEDKPAIMPKVVALQDENARLRRELKESVRTTLEAEEVRTKIFGLAEKTEEVPAWLAPPPAHKRKQLASVPSTIWSDWHLGEVVRRAEVNGVNAFNLTIADERIKRLVERTIDLCFAHMTGPTCPGIVVNMLGDMVSGDIHTELSETNEAELFVIILWARDRIIAALRRMADAFGRVFVPCTPGNHGRTTRKPQAKRYLAKNADWLIYCLVERHFRERGDDRVQFQIPETGEALYRVFNHRYLGVHGDDLGVKGGDGIIGAIGPIMRGEIKVHGSSSQIGRDYDTLLMGHWHQTLWLPRAIVNNTLKGYDEYARRMLRAPATPPSQNLWFTHPLRGLTARWEVYLDDAPAATDAPWLSFENAAKGAA